MHIGVIGSITPDTFEDNIRDTLVRMGHSVTCLGSTKPKAGNRIPRRAAEITRQAYPGLEARSHTKIALMAMERECDAVITCDGAMAPTAIEMLDKNRIPAALWFPDCVGNLGRQRMLAAPYKAIFFKDKVLVKRLQDTLNLPVWHLPEACNPNWHRPIGEPGKMKYIVVAGNTYLTRLLLLEKLHREGVPLVIFGAPIPRWAPEVIPRSLHMGRSVFKEEKSRIFRESSGVLNNLHPAEMSSVNARLFEATAAGAAVLCERRPELPDLFDMDREVVPFTTFGELLDHARHLLSDSSQSATIGDAATKRSHSEHSYEVRLLDILNRLL